MAEVTGSNKDLKDAFGFVGDRIGSRGGEHDYNKDAGQMEKVTPKAAFGKKAGASLSGNLSYGDLDSLATVLVANEEAKLGKRTTGAAAKKEMGKAFDEILASPQGVKAAFQAKLDSALKEYAANEAAGAIADDAKIGMKLTDEKIAAMGTTRTAKLAGFRTEAKGNMEAFEKAAALLGEDAVKDLADKQAGMLIEAGKDKDFAKKLNKAVDDGDKVKAQGILDDLGAKVKVSAMNINKDTVIVSNDKATTSAKDVAGLIGGMAQTGGKIALS